MRIPFVLIAVGVLPGCFALDDEIKLPRGSGIAAELVASGVEALEHGKIARAEASFDLAEEIAPSAEGKDGLGAIAFLDGRLDDAEGYYKAAYAEGYAPAAWHAAMAEEASGNTDEAEARYRAALRESPDDARLRNNFAVFLLEHGERFEARAELLRASILEENPLIDSNLAEAARSARKRR
jgi:Tfp pilus assembly protein PilF